MALTVLDDSFIPRFAIFSTQPMFVFLFLDGRRIYLRRIVDCPSYVKEGILYIVAYSSYCSLRSAVQELPVG